MIITTVTVVVSIYLIGLKQSAKYFARKKAKEDFKSAVSATDGDTKKLRSGREKNYSYVSLTESENTTIWRLTLVWPVSMSFIGATSMVSSVMRVADKFTRSSYDETMDNLIVELEATQEKERLLETHKNDLGITETAD